VAWILVFIGLPPGKKYAIRRCFFEGQAPLWNFHSHLKDVFDYWSIRTSSKAALMEISRDLARENAYLKLRWAEMLAENKECKALWNLYALPPSKSFHHRLARVSRRHIDTWNQYLYIDKGSVDGIPVGAGVIGVDGVVGRIVEVYRHTSVVELVTQRSFRIVGVDTEQRTSMVYQGIGCLPFSRLYGKAQNIPLSFNPSSLPVNLVTSPLSGIFPAGIPLGTLEDVQHKDGLAHGKVRLPESLTWLKEVSVLIPVCPTNNINE
jgi:rod shape-determining protein MreC